MNLGRAQAIELATSIKNKLTKLDENVESYVFPSTIHLETVSEILKGSPIRVGCQNIYPSHLAAFTGETSIDQLKDMGIDLVMVGHSERRQFMNESNAFLREKNQFALENGLSVIYCVGETLEERESGSAKEVISRQIREGLQGISSSLFSNLQIAYEPVWAIGTGKVATPELAQEMHQAIRNEIAGLFQSGEEIAEKMPILYGGSVKPDNVKSLLSQKDIDGGLVGGASQKAETFLALF